MTIRCLFALPRKTVFVGLILTLLLVLVETLPGFAQNVESTADGSTLNPTQTEAETPETASNSPTVLAVPLSEPVSAPMPIEQAPEPQEEPFPLPHKDPLGAARWLLSKPPGTGQHLTPFAMFRSADFVVKVVILGLAFASLVTWTVWLAKTLELWGARRRARRAIKALVRSTTLAQVQDIPKANRGVVGRMLRAASEEVARSEKVLDYAGGSGLKERVAASLGRIEARAGRRIARGTGILATIGSTAPFIGLFGTVWGIMNAFVSIAESNTTNLAVVAPGIAEALLATAIGLVAAIPAVIIYNIFVRSVAGYRHLLGDAGELIERLISRDIDMRAIPAPQKDN